MATPTTYDLSYDDPCTVEGQCGEDQCGGKEQFNARPQVFCRTVRINGRTVIIPAAITVGGITFTPKQIEGINGSFTVLAA